MNEFTLANYRSFLLTLKEDYQFTSFSKAKYSRDSHSGKILLRHDIDLSLEKAVEMAQVENEVGATATYFLFLRSPFYNIFSNIGEELVKKIIACGHHIGLHFDYSRFMNITPPEVNYRIMKEVAFIEGFFNIKLDGVSFHRPFDIQFFERLEMGTYPHAYEQIFTRDFKYFSDSRGLWRYGHPLESEAYKKRDPLQILVHPIWWINDAEDQSSFNKLKLWKKDMEKNFMSNSFQELKGFWENNTDRSFSDF